MSESAPTTGALAQALAEAGIETPIHEVDALVRGVAAAAVQDRDWLRLIHPEVEAGAAYAERLEALQRTYAEAPDGIDTPQQEARLAALRAELARRSLDGFVVPLSDEHQGEYVARRSQRLAWLTGFTGSAGMAIVLVERAALFIDGAIPCRRRRRWRAASTSTVTSPRSRPTRGSGSISRKRRARLRPPASRREPRDRMAAPCRAIGACLVPCEDNPIDVLWADQPPAPLGPIAPHPARFAGAETGEKREIVAARLAEKGAAPRC